MHSLLALLFTAALLGRVSCLSLPPCAEATGLEQTRAPVGRLAGDVSALDGEEPQ